MSIGGKISMERIDFNTPKGWSWKKFQDVCVLKRGYDLPTQVRSTGNFPLYSANGVTDYIDQYKVHGPGVVTGRSGTIGKVHFIEGDYWPLNTALYVQKFNGNYPRFIKYFLESFDLTRFASGAAVPTLNRNSLSAELVCVPDSLDEQKRIAEKLDALFTSIDSAIGHLQDSITLADTLLKNGLAEIFEGLKDRYEVVPLSSVVKINSGIALPKPFKNGFSDGDIAFFKVAQMNNHHENMVKPEITFNEKVAKEYKIKLFPKGSTLIPKRGGAILTNKKRILLEDASYDSNIMGLKADESKLSDDYLFAFMRTIHLANFVDASTIPQVNNKHIDQMQIPLVGLAEQKDVVSRVNMLVKKVETMNYEIQSQLNDLLALKKSILDYAFKGEL
ncbi:restriction endonuclease subunit S [Acinetobacter oleivorans]|uniref:restriction endonuclease subunit S n=1 Tax=Acinetobacter oleivorans TaxID=1148157 RepID=UPI00190214B0|nr:restriction endonuclease subunit S [Acinetobacter oleivorans]MBJ9738756.1 restriction endonuclease subunit S [Acinetobacter oleivorans]